LLRSAPVRSIEVQTVVPYIHSRLKKIMAPSTVMAGSPVVQGLSWGQAARGAEAEEGAEGLHPAKRGERLCRCFGQVLVMLRHYGWIAPLDDIDHPDAYWNGGRIYVAADDIERGVSLRPGDRVGFFLYVDHRGLGAEGCTLAPVALSSALPARGLAPVPKPACGEQGRCSQRPSNWSAEADKFVPVGRTGTSSMNPGAAEFVPAQALPAAASTGKLQVAPLTGCGLDVLKFNAACFFDSEDESDGGVEAGDERSEGFGEYESEEEEFSADVHADTLSLVSSDSPVEWDEELDVVVLCAPLKVPHQRAASLDGSTSASDAEDQFDRVTAPLCSLSMPPGLSVLAP